MPGGSGPVQSPALICFFFACRTKIHCLLNAVKIGRPGYRVTKQFDQGSQQRSLLFQVGLASLCRGLCLLRGVRVLVEIARP